MSYIGNDPRISNIVKIDNIAFDGVTTTFNLLSSGVAVIPGSALAMLVQLNGVLQEPIADYVVNGSSITFVPAPPTTSTFFGVALGKSLDVAVGIISDGTISDAKLSGPVSVAKGGTGSTNQVAAKIALGVITSVTGSNIGAVGTTAERPVAPNIGHDRFNTTLNSSEVWNGTSWAPMGGGATGAPGNNVFVENDQAVTGNYTLTAGKNAMSAGPVAINTGVTVTIPTGAVWTIV